MSRVLLIGLDAAEPSLLRAWAAAGFLPNLHRIVATGSSADLTSPARHFQDAVWPVLYTSRNPARVAPHFFIRPNPATARLELVHHDMSGAEPFWLTASRHRRRCAVVDAPKIGPHPPVDGIQLVNWGAHATTAPMASHPDNLAPRVVAVHGRHPVRVCDDHGPSLAEYARMRRALLAGVEARRRLHLDRIRSLERAGVVAVLIAHSPLEPRARRDAIGAVAHPHQRRGLPESGPAPPARHPRDSRRTARAHDDSSTRRRSRSRRSERSHAPARRRPRSRGTRLGPGSAWSGGRRRRATRTRPRCQIRAGFRSKMSFCRMRSRRSAREQLGQTEGPRRESLLQVGAAPAWGTAFRPERDWSPTSSSDPLPCRRRPRAVRRPAPLGRGRAGPARARRCRGRWFRPRTAADRRRGRAREPPS